MHLLDPQTHKIDPDFDYPDPVVDVCGPLFVQDRDKRYLREITTYGVTLPRPANAPSVFRQTRPSSAMDKVVRAWKNAGLLVPNRQLKHAMQMFLVPKPDGAVRPIIDYSPWTEFITAPHFSLLSAGEAVRRISPYAHMIKIDLRSGFHQIPLAAGSYNYNGIFYRGEKLSLTRLPMGHALAPAVFQRWSEGVLREVHRRSGAEAVAYLDDWLLWSHSDEELQRAVTAIEALGITINYEKSTLIPTQTLTYLGFRICTTTHTIKLLLQTFDRMNFLLRLVRQGSEKDSWIHGFCAWIAFNLRLPQFLNRDILAGDPTWMAAAVKDLDILRPRPLMDPIAEVNLYTDATPNSIAAIIPALDMAHARAFDQTEEINFAEMAAAIDGLTWAASDVRDTHIKLYTDNATVLHSLLSGKGYLFRRHLLRRLYLSMLHALHDNTFSVHGVTGLDNPADKPSREILEQLLEAPHRRTTGQPQAGYYLPHQFV